MIYLFIFIILCVVFLILPSSKNEVKIIKLKHHIIPLLIVFFLLLLVTFSKSSFESAHTGFMLWANNVVPSLLPFLIGIEMLKMTKFMHIIGRLLEKIMRPIFNVPGAGAFALALGISSGYPVGSKVVSNLRSEHLCNKYEAERLLSFTNTSGPIFIVGAVGVGMFNDSKIGLMLLITHFLGAILVGLVFRNYHKSAPTSNILPYNNSVYNNNASFTIRNLGEKMGIAIKKSIDTLLLICGYIVFFSVIGNMLQNTGIMNFMQIIIERFLNLFDISNNASNGIIRGILEVTNGIKELSTLNNMPYIKLLSLVAFLLGFGGLSVHMQTASIIANTDISIKPYLLGKLLHGIFSSVLSYILMKYTSFFSWDVVETFSYNYKINYPASSSSNMFLVIITTMIIIGITMNIFNAKKEIRK